MSSEPKTILISGWRGLSHSFALVNQFQCLDLLRRDDVRLYFRDSPFYNQNWESGAGLFSSEDETAIASIPPPPGGLTPDAELRFDFPVDLVTPPNGRRSFVFGTAEYQTVAPRNIVDSIPLRDAHALHGGSMGIVTPSEWSRQGFIQSGADPRRVYVVPHGVDMSIFHPPAPEARTTARQRYGFGPNDFVFLHVGAMTGNKNIEILLRGFAAVLKEVTSARLVMKGSDSLFTSKALYMSAVLAALGPDDAQRTLSRITYLGGCLSFAEMRELYQAADCYVSPYGAEGFNMPVLEATACGLPVICTAGGPTDEFTNERFARRIRSTIVTGEVDGLPTAHLEPDAGHLFKLMLDMTDNEEFRRAAATEGPAFVGAGFTWRHVVDKLLGVLFAK